MKLHTILGAGGAVGNQLFPLLQENHRSVRLVSRNAEPIAHVEAVPTDITNYEQTLDAVKGSDTVYLVAGLAYDIRVWKKSWPKIMTNVIDACKKHNSKLIFFDNVYMYGKVDGTMTEETPFNPVSKKGEIRAKIATQLLNEMKAGNIKAIIAQVGGFLRTRWFYHQCAEHACIRKFKERKKSAVAVKCKSGTLVYLCS